MRTSKVRREFVHLHQMGKDTIVRRLERSFANVGHPRSRDVTGDRDTQAASERRDVIARHGEIRLLFRLTGFAVELLDRARRAAGRRSRRRCRPGA